MSTWPVCRVPERPRISRHRSAAASAVPGLPRGRPSSSSSESQPSTTASSASVPATASALSPASRRASSATVGASTPVSSTPLTTTAGSRPALRSVASRAGEAEARTSGTRAVTGGPSQAEGLADHALHDLAGAAVDARDARVGVAARDRVFGHVPVAAVQLQAAVDDAALQLGAVVLRLRRVGRGELAGVEPVDAAVDEGLRDVERGRDVGELELRVLERADA